MFRRRSFATTNACCRVPQTQTIEHSVDQTGSSHDQEKVRQAQNDQSLRWESSSSSSPAPVCNFSICNTTINCKLGKITLKNDLNGYYEACESQNFYRWWYRHCEQKDINPQQLFVSPSRQRCQKVLQQIQPFEYNKNPQALYQDTLSQKLDSTSSVQSADSLHSIDKGFSTSEDIYTQNKISKKPIKKISSIYDRPTDVIQVIQNYVYCKPKNAGSSNDNNSSVGHSNPIRNGISPRISKQRQLRENNGQHFKQLQINTNKIQNQSQKTKIQEKTTPRRVWQIPSKIPKQAKRISASHSQAANCSTERNAINATHAKVPFESKIPKYQEESKIKIQAQVYVPKSDVTIQLQLNDNNLHDQNIVAYPPKVFNCQQNLQLQFQNVQIQNKQESTENRLDHIRFKDKNNTQHMDQENRLHNNDQGPCQSRETSCLNIRQQSDQTQIGSTLKLRNDGQFGVQDDQTRVNNQLRADAKTLIAKETDQYKKKNRTNNKGDVKSFNQKDVVQSSQQYGGGVLQLLNKVSETSDQIAGLEDKENMPQRQSNNHEELEQNCSSTQLGKRVQHVEQPTQNKYGKGIMDSIPTIDQMTSILAMQVNDMNCEQLALYLDYKIFQAKKRCQNA